MDTIWRGDWQKELIPEGKTDPRKTVKSIHNLQFHSATFSRCLLHSRLLDAVEDVMGTEDILLGRNSIDFIFYRGLQGDRSGQ